MELPPFPEAEEEELSQFLGKTFKVKIAGDLSRNWFLYLESNPGLLTSLIRDAVWKPPDWKVIKDLSKYI